MTKRHRLAYFWWLEHWKCSHILLPSLYHCILFLPISFSPLLTLFLFLTLIMIHMVSIWYRRISPTFRNRADISVNSLSYLLSPPLSTPFFLSVFLSVSPSLFLSYLSLSSLLICFSFLSPTCPSLSLLSFTCLSSIWEN